MIAEAIRSGDVKPDLPPESQPLAEAAETARAALLDASRASPRDPAAVRAAEDAQRATAAALRDAKAAHVAQLVLDLFGGSAAVRPVVRRWSASSQLVGKGKDRVMLRVACAAASAQVRAAERDLRRETRDGAA